MTNVRAPRCSDASSSRWTGAGSKRRSGPPAAVAAAIGSKGLALVEPQLGGKYLVRTVAPDAPGTLSPVEYRTLVADLVNFLDYMGEPVRNKRITLGIVVMLFLGLLFFFAYWLKREYWKDVH